MTPISFAPVRPCFVAAASTLLVAGMSGAWAISNGGYILEDAQAAIDDGEFEEAIFMLEEIMEFEGEDAESLNLMGYSLRNLDRNEEAMEYYNRALEMDPDHQGALEYQGELFLKLGNQAAAESNLQKLAELCPEGCDAHGTLETAIERFKDGGLTSWTPPTAE